MVQKTTKASYEVHLSREVVLRGVTATAETSHVEVHIDAENNGYPLSLDTVVAITRLEMKGFSLDEIFIRHVPDAAFDATYLLETTDFGLDQKTLQRLLDEATARGFHAGIAYLQVDLKNMIFVRT